jgi:hypothetical protein
MALHYMLNVILQRYPLLSNDRSLSPAQVLTAHKGQQRIEKRFEQLKSVHEVAPVFLKNEARSNALFTLYFLGLLVQALIERELRQGMKPPASSSCPCTPRRAPATGPPPNTSCGCSAWPSASPCSPAPMSWASSRPSSPSCSAESLACSGCPPQPTPEADFRYRGISSMCGMWGKRTRCIFAITSGRPSVMSNKNFSPVMVALIVTGLVPASTRCSWKRRRSSTLAESGDRPRNTASLRTARM